MLCLITLLRRFGYALKQTVDTDVTNEKGFADST